MGRRERLHGAQRFCKLTAATRKGRLLVKSLPFSISSVLNRITQLGRAYSPLVFAAEVSSATLDRASSNATRKATNWLLAPSSALTEV